MTEIQHELIMPNKDLPFKMFLFEGRDGNYIREKHWHRSIEIFAVFQGTLEFYLNDQEYLLECGDFIIVNSNEVHSIDSPEENHTCLRSQYSQDTGCHNVSCQPAHCGKAVLPFELP